MNSFVKKLSLDRVESGAAGDEAQFLYKFWRQNEGFYLQDSQVTHLSKKLMLFRPDLVPDDVPPVTLIGKDSTFRNYLPPSDQPTSLPLDYRRKVAPGYHAAIRGEPWYDIQRTGDMMGEGTPDLTLERLVLKFQTPGGFERIFCLLWLLEEHSGSGLSYPEHHHARFRPGIGRYQSGWVHQPASAPHLHAGA